MGLIYLFLLLGGVAIILVYGERYERIAIVIIVVGSVLSLLVLLQVENRWTRMETNILLIDTVAIFAFFLIAQRSNRTWPLWLTGLEIIVAASHAARFYYPAIVPKAYAFGEGLWSYLQIVILIIVALRIRRTKLNAKTEHSSPD